MILTDEEIKQIELGWSSEDDEFINLTDIAKAQLKKVVEFLDYYEATLEPALDCSHTRFDIPTEKWQSLLEEVK